MDRLIEKKPFPVKKIGWGVGILGAIGLFAWSLAGEQGGRSSSLPMTGI